jgi:O-antigen/teichoic acid export membrane protein
MFFGRIFSLVISFFVTIYVVRYLGPENYGKLSYAVGFVGLFSIFASLGINNVLYRELIRFPEKRKEYLGTSLVLKFIASIFTILITIGVSLLINKGDTIILFLTLIISLSFIFQSFSVFNVHFNSKIQSKTVTLSTTISYLITSVSKILVVFLNKGILYLSSIIVLEVILNTIFILYLYNKDEGNLKIKFKKELAIQLLKDSWPFIFISTFAVIYARIDQVMLKSFMGVSFVGIYDSAVRLTEVWYMIPNIIMASLFPAIINAKNNLNQYRRRLRNAAILLFILAVGFSVLIFASSEILIKVLYGSSFSGASIVLKIYTWSLFGSFLTLLTHQYLLSENKQLIIFASSLLTMVVNIFLNIMWIPSFGITGAAWATVVSYTINPLVILMSRKVREDFFSR